MRVYVYQLGEAVVVAIYNIIGSVPSGATLWSMCIYTTFPRSGTRG